MVTAERRRTTARMTSKGQVTIPKRIRDRLGVKPGEQVDFFEQNGTVFLRRHFDEKIFQTALDKVSGIIDLEGMTVDEWIDDMRGE